MPIHIVALHGARYAEAASCFAKSVQNNPRFSTFYFCQAAALALDGRVKKQRRLSDRGWNSNRASVSANSSSTSSTTKRSRTSLKKARAYSGYRNSLVSLGADRIIGSIVAFLQPPPRCKWVSA